MLRLQVLGDFHVWVASTPVPQSACRQRRDAAILKLLAWNGSHRLHREQVPDTL